MPMVQGPAIERGERIRRQMAPAVDGGIYPGIEKESAEGFIGVAVQLAGGVLAASQHAARMSVAETPRGASVDAGALERRECRASLAATV